MSYIYLEEQQGYLIPVTSQMGLYTPKVEQLKKQDDKLRVTVGYVPTPALSGDYSMSTPSEPTKYMDYIFEKNGRTWYLTALETSEMKPAAGSTTTASQPTEDAVGPEVRPHQSHCRQRRQCPAAGRRQPTGGFCRRERREHRRGLSPLVTPQAKKPRMVRTKPCGAFSVLLRVLTGWGCRPRRKVPARCPCRTRCPRHTKRSSDRGRRSCRCCR